MSDLYDKHRDTLEQALEAINKRSYWSAFPEHPKAYGEDAPADGEAAFEARLGKPFSLDQPHDGYLAVEETSPYGIELDIDYPKSSIEQLIDGAQDASVQWGKTSPEARAGVLIEVLDRLAAQSFEMGHAVMATTGQSFLMAFQAGGPHALDRALEAIAYTYAEQHRLPAPMTWEKPQGKREPLVIDKEWVIRPRGVAVTIGVSTFPTWNGYPGIFASLAAGNPVIVKPHPATILPFAIMVETARAVFQDAGFDPNLVTLLTDTPGAPVAKDLVMHPAVAIVDYTGGPSFGTWLEENVHHAAVYTEKAGVNSVILDSADDLADVFRNLSVSMTMYSGQMCTTPQNLYIPRGGVKVGGEVVPFDDVAVGFAAAIDGLLSDDERAVGLLGAIKTDEISARIDEAATSGDVLLESRQIDHPAFPKATVRTPVVVKVDAADRNTYMREMFGPIVYVVATESTDESLQLAARSAREKGAITWLVYTTDEAVTDSAIDAAVEGGVSVAFNLTGGLYVNQSAAFSDFHVTGHNPAGNASLTDPAFVAGRFKVIGVRRES
ncbi:MAG: phenylacetic acid degradation protein PaaN [Acidobacteria bacterium]|nr:phenylacetic acid degradation protein PaaN [Acidobacteriota bacterium]